MRIPFRTLSLQLLAALCAAPAMAQQNADEAKAKNLDGVVVTASGFEQAIEQAPASISVIGRPELETRPFHDLTDALRDVEGVSVTGPAGQRDIFIRGMPGQYTLILVDGKRQSTRDSRTNGNSGFEQSFIPPLEAIERIEVVRGPMSSLYGSDAMGGVINIITRKVPQRWGGSLGVDYTLQQHDDSGDAWQGQFYAGGPLAAGRVGLQLWGRQYGRREDALLNGYPGAREGDLSARLAIAPDARQDILLEAGHENVRRENRGGRTLAANAADTYNRNPRDRWSASHAGRWSWGQSDLALYQESTQRIDYARNADGSFVRRPRAPEIRNRTADAKLSLPLDAHNLVLGGQWTQARLTDQNPGRRSGASQHFSIGQKALFAEDEWQLAERFALTGGARLDRHQIYGNHWSPRLYGVWRSGGALILKGGVSRGFRAPEIRQIAPGYAYTTGGANCSYGPNGNCAVIVGDPHLKPETSTSAELAAIWDAGRAFSAGLTLFHTRFRDKVMDVQPLDAGGRYLRWSEDPNYRLYYWSNVDKARIQGGELTARWSPAAAWTLKGNYTYTDSEQQSGNYKGYALARTPRHLANLRADWTPRAAWSLWAAANYHGREINAQLRTGSAGKPVTAPNGRVVREYGAYATADLGATWRLGGATTLNAALYNLTDRRLDYDTYNNVEDGRRLWLGMTVKL
ncbi:ligand-gated channel protein [Frateuria sp. Soil773]|uniref:TonB-dependent receptor domain-containing protein n=1 Tax=Frateuria sp. Soil773 TaxID=1736407 RepID=UPI0006F61AEE|nr:TonB-dependent receptor [Frateuria sp. Soil773]KRE88808.1 ligand-gated channel protein [Frateuria sp. Soil773]